MNDKLMGGSQINVQMLKMFGGTLILFGFIFSVLGQNCDKSPRNDEERLKRFLVCFNDPMVRPVKDPNGQIKLQISAQPKFIFLEPNNHFMRITVHLKLKWKNEFVTWNPKDYDNIQKLMLPGESVWTPGLSAMMNRHSPMAMNLKKYPVWVESDGQSTILATETIGVICTSDMKSWPNLVQTCNLFLSNPDTRIENIVFVTPNEKMNMSLYRENRAWEFINGMQRAEIWGNALHKTSVLRCSFTMKSHSFLNTAATVVPIAVSVVMILLSFLMSPLENLRFAFLVISMGLHILYLQLVGTLTFSGDEDVYLILFLKNSLIMNFVALVLLRVSRTMILVSGMPHSLISLRNKINTMGWSTYILLPTEASPLVSEDEVVQKARNGETKEGVIAAVLFDRICFLSYFMFYLTILLV
nr:nicotinic acetylcholine receptor beta 3 subunit [Orius laevigatus]